MEHIKTALQANLPASFRDARLTLESALQTTALTPLQALTTAYSVATSLGAVELGQLLSEGLPDASKELAEVAAASMAMTNVFYSFLDMAGIKELSALPAQIRMVGYGQQVAKDAFGFEVATLAVSIAGKCRSCIVAHVTALKKQGATDETLRDIAKIAAAVNSVSKGYAKAS
ncbi:carboxymuconolactone decarboxylase family protein [Nostoc sp. CHAB 5834]|nr:carboxymuconolactone decarboxylase family protein [Nostoc sp. CHAB 5834]